jgi:hypothetical protein
MATLTTEAPSAQPLMPDEQPSSNERLSQWLDSQPLREADAECVRRTLPRLLGEYWSMAAFGVLSVILFPIMAGLGIRLAFLIGRWVWRGFFPTKQRA